MSPDEKAEVARLTHIIENACRAIKRGIQAYGAVSKSFLTVGRFQVIAAYQNELAQLIGENEARELVESIFTAIMEEKTQS